MKFFLTVFLFFLLSFPAYAQENGNVVIDMAEDHIDITSGFTGETVTVFGATDQDGDIAVVLRGPDSRITVRQKQPAFGMWLNRDSVDFRDVPLFYSYAVSQSESRMAEAATLNKYHIGLNALSFDAADYKKNTNTSEFHEAMVSTRQAEGLFPLVPSTVRFLGQKMFRASFYLPSNVPVGRYKVEAYLFKDGAFIGSRSIDLSVAQAGLSGNILNFAADHSFLYAISALMIAISAGFMAYWVSRGQRV